MSDENPHGEDAFDELIDDPVDMPDRRLWIWVALAGVVLIAGWFTAPYAYREVKARRANGYVREAQRAFEAGDLTNGPAKLRMAVTLAPDDVGVLRMAAETLALLRNPDSLNFYSRLEEKGVLTREDRLNRARVAIPAGRLEVAGGELARLYKETPKDATVIGLSLELFRAMGNFAKAREAALELLAATPDSRDAKLAAGGLLAADLANPTNRTRGLALLLDLAHSPGAHQTNSWQLLSGLPGLDREQLVALVHTVTNRPVLSLDHRITAAEFARRADSNNVAAWVPSITGAMAGASPDAAYVAGATWLLNHGQAGWLLEHLPADKVRRDFRLLPIRLQALVETGAHAEVRHLLDDPGAALSEFDRFLFRGAAAWQAGARDEAATHLGQALELGTNRFQARRVARTAMDLGAWKPAVAAWRRLVDSPSERLDAAVNLIRSALNLGDARILLDAYDRFLSVVPGDNGVRFETAYLRLVLDEGASGVAAEIDRFPVALRPTERVQLLLAFSQLRGGQAVEALATAERMTLDWPKGEPRWQALYASLLAANGQREAARRIAALVPAGALTPAERECYGVWISALR